MKQHNCNWRLKFAVSFLIPLLHSCGGGGNSTNPSQSASPSSPDLEAPTVRASAELEGEGTDIQQRIVVTESNDNVAIAAYCLSSSNYRPSASNACFTSTKEWVVPIGPIRYVWTKDYAGNISSPSMPQVCSTEGIAASQASTLPNVCIRTDYGDIVVELESSKAPISVANFMSYVTDGFYQNTIFHRVLKGFAVQGGAFELVDGARTTKKNSKAAIALEKTTSTGLSNVQMTIAMARTTDPNSATSQFYFNIADNSKVLDSSASQDGYAVFGRVIYGLSVISQIQNEPVEPLNAGGEVSSPVKNIYVQWAYIMK